MSAAILGKAQVDERILAGARDIKQACDELGLAIEGGKLGDIVAKHETMILHYYRDVQEQAQRSFLTARWFGWGGFAVLVITLAYVTVLDALGRFQVITPLPKADEPSVWMTVANVGVISGILIEFISGVGFWLYRRTSEQFAAFHICLERTHRYLIAYVCIMAKAPMITRSDLGIAQTSGGMTEVTYKTRGSATLLGGGAREVAPSPASRHSY